MTHVGQTLRHMRGNESRTNNLPEIYYQGHLVTRSAAYHSAMQPEPYIIDVLVSMFSEKYERDAFITSTYIFTALN